MAVLGLTALVAADPVPAPDQLTPVRQLLVAVLGLTALVAVSEAYPRPQSRYEPAPVYRPVYEEEPDYRPRYEPQIESRQGGYGKPKAGHVKIQVGYYDNVAEMCNS